MILKVRKPGGWAIVDGIIKATFEYSGKGPFRMNAETNKWQVLAKNFSLDETTGDRKPNNTWQDCGDSPGGDVYMDTHFGKPSKDGYFYPTTVRLDLEHTSYPHRTIVFNTDAYFMNENGKTIETILGC